MAYGQWVNAHKALWAPTTAPTIQRTETPAASFRTLRTRGLTFRTQNVRKDSPNTTKVRAGWKITWVFRGHSYIGEVTQSPQGKTTVIDFDN